jgi:hypothetical protein
MATRRRFDLEEGFAGLDFHSVRLEQRSIRAMEAWRNDWTRQSGKRAKAGRRLSVGGRLSGRAAKRRHGGWLGVAALFWRYMMLWE